MVVFIRVGRVLGGAVDAHGALAQPLSVHLHHGLRGKNFGQTKKKEIKENLRDLFCVIELTKSNESVAFRGAFLISNDTSFRT